jgi:hypothetical protein
MEINEFSKLMSKLANAWMNRSTNTALECFKEDAIYMEPPDKQLYIGHVQLKPYFDALREGVFFKFHNIMFNEQTQVGSCEYSFGNIKNEICDTGVLVIELENNKIKFWREYQTKGSTDFNSFKSIHGKKCEWTIENYP